MAETKPTKVGQWATNANRTLEPALGEKQVGWEVAKKAPARFMNWLHWVAYSWFNWFNERMFDGGSTKDFEIRGVDIVAGTDVDGGDLELGGGSSTGDGGSEVTFKVAVAGQGAGAAVRAPVLAGSFKENRAFNRVPLAADPASGAAGDSAVRSPGKSILHNGTSWDKHVVDSYVTVVSSSEIADTGAETNFDQSYTIPANTLRVGDVIRMRALCIVLDFDGAPNLTVRPKLSTQQFGSMLFAVGVTTDYFWLDWSIVIQAIGASGDLYGYGSMTLIDNTGIAAVVHSDALLATAVDTTGALVAQIGVIWSAAHVDNRVRMESFIVGVN